jgi:hypothetical protein
MVDNELGIEIGAAAMFLAPNPRQLAALLRDKHGLRDAELDAIGHGIGIGIGIGIKGFDEQVSEHLATPKPR